MTLIYRSILAAILIYAAPHVSYAETLRCSGKIISPGDTQQQLLDACGHPKSRRDNDWLYERPGSFPLVVTVNRGVVTFIRNLEESGAFRHPYGDRP
ncbi:MAG: DUF2845 domain-containing protein [Pseudomonadota bacterium]|nr:DUF2845 domain-containing protein [Pseudomonadota bacterium]